MEYNNEEVLEGLKIAKKIEELDYSSYIKEIVVLLNEFNYFTDGNLISLKKREIKVDKLSNLMDPLTNAIKLKSFLSSKIYGQEMAIDAVVDGIKNKVVDSTNMYLLL